MKAIHDAEWERNKKKAWKGYNWKKEARKKIFSFFSLCSISARRQLLHFPLFSIPSIVDGNERKKTFTFFKWYAEERKRKSFRMNYLEWPNSSNFHFRNYLYSCSHWKGKKWKLKKYELPCNEKQTEKIYKVLIKLLLFLTIFYIFLFFCLWMRHLTKELFIFTKSSCVSDDV